MRKLSFLGAFVLGTFAFAQTYCTPAFSSGCSYGDQINGFTIPSASFSHLSTGCSSGAYGDFTSQTINLNAGLTYDFTVTHGYSNQVVKIWIDFNDDGTFDTTTELVASGVSGSASSTTATISIPATATLGNHRMRVGDRYSSDPIPCNVDGYGEAHDYTVAIGAAPSCLTATGLAISNVTSNSATLQWVASPSTPASGYEYYVTSSTNLPTASTVATGSVGAGILTTPLGSLSPATDYKVYVRAFCTTTSKSNWSSPVSFKTSCVAITTLPWTENFDSMGSIGNAVLPNCWSTTGGSSSYMFTTQDASAQSYNDPKSNPNYVTIYYPTTAALLWTPGFTLTAGQSYDFSFYWAGDGYSGWVVDGLVNTSATETGATSLGNFVAQSTTTTSAYTKQLFTYVPTTTGTYYFAVKAFSATWDPYYMGFDDFKVEATPACSEPTGLTVNSFTSNSVSVSWNTPSVTPSNGYQYYYSTSSTAPTASTSASGTSASVSMTVGSLAPATTYYLYVRANCGGSTSSWSPAVIFTTSCVATNPNYTMNFDGTTNNCLSVINAGSGNVWTVASTPTDVINGTFTGNVMKYAYNGSNPANTWFFTQGVNLVAGTTYYLSYLYANNSDTYSEKMLVAAGTSPTAAAMTTTINDHSSISGGAQNSSTNNAFTPTTSGVYYFGFKAYSDADQFYLYVDDIQLTAGILATSETKSKEFNAIKVYPNPFTDLLTISDVKDVKSITISDMSGKVVKTFEKPESTIRLSGLNSGMYLVILTMNDGSKQTIKAIKK